VTSLQQLMGRDAPRAPDRDSLEAWGRALGAALSRPAVVAFAGELGAGKTTLVRAVCEGLGVSDPSLVTSPTFALIQEYPAKDCTVVHADLYRLRTDAELEGLGWDEIVANACVLLVEWPERAINTLPPDTIMVELNHDPDHPDRRRLWVKQLGR